MIWYFDSGTGHGWGFALKVAARRPVLNAIKIHPSQKRAWTNEVTYCVQSASSAAAPAGQSRTAPKARDEKRSSCRVRTRLCPAMIITPGELYATECQVYDRSASGARLRIPGAASIPRRFRLFDETQMVLMEVAAVWRRGRDIGVRFLKAARPRKVDAADLALLRAGYNPAQAGPPGRFRGLLCNG